MRAGPSEQRNILGSPGSESWSHETRMSPLYGLALCCIAAASWGAPVFAADSYTITRLPVPSGYEFVSPAGINDSGQVTGYLRAGAYERAFRWSSATEYEFLFPQFEVVSLGVSINSAGHVAGISGQTYQDSFIWRGPNDVTTLTKGGFTSTSVSGLSDSGDVAGYVGSAGATYPAIWDAANNLTVINFPRVGQASGVNASGVVIGTLDQFDRKGFIWSETAGLQILQGLLGYSAGPNAINNSGVVVGASGDAFLWTESDGIQSLGPGNAVGINDLNVVILNHQNSCFMWDSINGRRDLNTLGDFVGWNLTDAIGINDQGQIVGRGQYQSLSAAFVLTPVPEPSTAILLGASLGVGLWCLRRRSPAEDC